MRNEIKAILFQNIWLIALLIIAGGFVVYTKNNALDGDGVPPQELSSQSFRILDSTLTPRPVEQTIIIEPIR
ncbi:MAG: hypothetical protein COU90_01035 [Candidatus Ryanbacteria bacterium CG10_big_fil_rev_8_21_14_0_10_43_42]|uniref:Uncharacterized protein n=1 Tax=Candidatus Ryanbacteria bacterium CG10_big_fil_rev_8_21_14_0_10_43_42 TaxID=1974864 RepID=A0A2M8KY60_9BACT|nr:MAG: hypothetical protein COU90_01035 [Candidatus Ryanbacteria bacterium CG10_big_fil_rev_8_21_14_0_10_43_42]